MSDTIPPRTINEHVTLIALTTSDGVGCRIVQQAVAAVQFDEVQVTSVHLVGGQTLHVRGTVNQVIEQIWPPRPAADIF